MRTIAAFLRDERGSHTIEFVIWIPLFLFFLAATIDASVLYLTHTEMWNTARDTARRVTTGQLGSEDEAEKYAYDELLIGGRQYWITANIDSGEVKILIQTYIWDASVFGIFGLFSNGSGGAIMQTLDAEVTMRLEPSLV